MKTLVTLSTFAQYSEVPLKRLKEKGFEVITNPYGRKLTVEESFKLYTPDIDAVIAGTEEISSEIISKADSLKVISRCGIGLDNVDLAAARKKKIKLFTTGAHVIDAVAELTAGLILDSVRFVSQADRAVREERWHRPMGYLLRGKILGVIGLGQVGKRLIELMNSFGVNPIAYDLSRDQRFAAKYKVKYVSLVKLLSHSDIVSIHLPLNGGTRNLINAKTLSQMKKDAFFINTARGEIVDEQALYEALKNKKIAGAALDVFAQEPYSGPLKELDNIILTTHIGSYAREARINMELEAVENLIQVLNGYHPRRKYKRGVIL